MTPEEIPTLVDQKDDLKNAITAQFHMEALWIAATKQAAQEDADNDGSGDGEDGTDGDEDDEEAGEGGKSLSPANDNGKSKGASPSGARLCMYWRVCMCVCVRVCLRLCVCVCVCAVRMSASLKYA